MQEPEASAEESVKTCNAGRTTGRGTGMLAVVKLRSTSGAFCKALAAIHATLIAPAINTKTKTLRIK